MISRLAKKPIILPEGVTARMQNHTIIVKGPKGELARDIALGISFDISPSAVQVKITEPSKKTAALSGTYARHLMNMIEGVTKGFEKKLEIEGIGYRAEMRDQSLVLHVGLSHPVVVRSAEGVKVSVEKNTITVSGIFKDDVGNEAARIRKVRPPEPYKGKGIRYAGEVIRRKAGKRVATSA